MTIDAREYGFERAYALAPAYTPRTCIIPQNIKLKDDARELMPGAKCVLALIKPYAPYAQSAEGGRGAMVSAYYPASNAAYFGARKLASALMGGGYQAIENADLPVKPMLTRFGLARAGRNGLISIDGVGTRFHVQLMITNAPIDALAPPEPAPEFCLADDCANCRACVDACPAGALDMSGRVDVSKCLRALPAGEVVPARLRALMGDMLLGCDICQRVCPRNARVQCAPMPAALDEALALNRLLGGDIRALCDFFGRNYARARRIKMRAALIAGNQMRADCAPALEALAQSGAEGEQIHARWALDKINGGIAL